jgi:cysteinyl-tRNA synthetase
VKIWIHLGHLHIEGRKMSKSLKNFISIDDYFKSQLTSAPADDFRIYCMQHKYQATLTYSAARVEEAAKLRSKFESFFASTKALLTSPSGLQQTGPVERRRRPTPDSTKLSALVQKTQLEVHHALGDDFNTPAALHSLSVLAGESVQYLNLLLTPSPSEGAAGSAVQVYQQPIEPLLSSATYIARILTTLGLRFPATFNFEASTVASVGTAEGAEGGAQGVSDASIDAIVQFRSTVREAALQGAKALRIKRKDGAALTEAEVQLEAQLKSILGACDASRESLRSSLGIKVEDLGVIGKWTRV